MRDGEKKIKWCNGYGDKWKMNFNGDLLGVDPERAANGEMVPSAQHTYKGVNVLTNVLNVMDTTDPRHDNFAKPKGEKTGFLIIIDL